MISNLATLAQTLNAANREIRLLPPGVFRANDGRPADLPGWKIDAVIAGQIIAETAARDDLVIDFEHQTQLAAKNGQPAPAAGWFKHLVWREGLGLFAVDVKWTAKAQAMLAAREYRYISPVFTFNAVTGQVERLLGAGLTNNPGLSGLTDLAQVAINSNQPGPAHRDSPSSAEKFNRIFGSLGVFHPETTPGQIANLSTCSQKEALPEAMNPGDKEKLRWCFPSAFSSD